MVRACLARWAPKDSIYGTLPAEAMVASPAAQYAVAAGHLRALRADIEADALTRFEQLIHAGLFTDLIAQGEHLLSEGYLLAAAVLFGATLEAHLRHLADMHGIALKTAAGLPAKISNLNDQLAKARAYSKPDRDLVGGWLKIRNEAAHNEKDFEQRTEEELRLMAGGVRSFISRVPA